MVDSHSIEQSATSDPKDSKSFLSHEGKSFSKILYKFLDEIETVIYNICRIPR